MENNFNVKKLFKFLYSVVILIVLTLSYSYIWLHFYNRIINPTVESTGVVFKNTGNWLIIAFYFGILALFSVVFGSLKIGYLKMSNVIYSQMLTILCVNLITYFQICLVTRMLVPATYILALTAFDAFIVTVLVLIAQKLYSKLFPPRRLVIIYGSSLATELVYKMSSRYDKYRICYSMNISRGFEAIKELIPSFDGVIICDVESKIRNDILKFCYENSIRAYVTPKISDIIIRSADNIDLFDTPILLCRNTGLDVWEKTLKRFFDILLSLVALIVLSPFMLITALAIKIYDGGPVFFKQDRVTINGKIFKILKFRSMIVDAEKDGKSIPAVDNDPRITPVGKIIRKTRLDELPQIINILCGVMSIVGPRPERPEHIEEYEKIIPEFRYRLKVKGGLTGYAQVFGKYNTSAYDKLRLDLIYIQNYSFILDIKLILATIKILFLKESTEGFDKAVDINNINDALEKKNKK